MDAIGGINEMNASGRTASATVTRPDLGLAAVDVTDDEGGAQFGGSSPEGTCEDLWGTLRLVAVSPVARHKGRQLARRERTRTGTSVTLADLQNGAYAVVIVDVSYRGGNAVEIPPDVRMYEPPDPNGPFGGGVPARRVRRHSVRSGRPFYWPACPR